MLHAINGQVKVYNSAQRCQSKT